MKRLMFVMNETSIKNKMEEIGGVCWRNSKRRGGGSDDLQFVKIAFDIAIGKKLYYKNPFLARLQCIIHVAAINM